MNYSTNLFVSYLSDSLSSNICDRFIPYFASIFSHYTRSSEDFGNGKLSNLHGCNGLIM